MFFLVGTDLAFGNGGIHQRSDTRELQLVQLFLQVILLGDEPGISVLIFQNHIDLFLHVCQRCGIREAQHQGDCFQFFIHLR